jgi:hypothetical protein
MPQRRQSRAKGTSTRSRATPPPAYPPTRPDEVFGKGNLKRMQYRPGLLDGIVAETGLHLAEPP